MRWILTAVAAITGYLLGGFGGMEIAGEYAPEFDFFGFKGHMGGLVLGALIGASAAGIIMFIAVRDLELPRR